MVERRSRFEGMRKRKWYNSQDVYHCFLSSSVLEFNEESAGVEPVTGWFSSRPSARIMERNYQQYMYLRLKK